MGTSETHTDGSSMKTSLERCEASLESRLDNKPTGMERGHASTKRGEGKEHMCTRNTRPGNDTDMCRSPGMWCRVSQPFIASWTNNQPSKPNMDNHGAASPCTTNTLSTDTFSD
mmetsp:Transcript_1238/g.8149  ORF Transcript_1238/g.8149 Transcript_1238/m.8149 type:complete len:114 (+) Transcript_1238:2030-2371(+)